MTTAADDRAVEEAFEASLAGRPVPAEAAGLAAFTGAVRGAATQPGRPNAALAELLSTGLLTDQSSPSTWTAPAAGPLPSRGVRSRTRRRFTVIVPALLAKFLSAGAVAQAATGAGVVVVVVTGAGSAGVLPGGAQQTFSDLTGINEVAEEPVDVASDLESVEPVKEGDGLPGPDELPELKVPGTMPVDEEAELTEEEAAEKDWLAGPAEGQTFGEWVSLGRHEGWATGQIVSAKKHELNEARKEAREAARADEREDEAGDEVEAPEVEAPEVEDESGDDDTAAGSSDDDGKGSGKGKDKGKGRR
jgi:hypothetical protein